MYYHIHSDFLYNINIYNIYTIFFAKFLVCVCVRARSPRLSSCPATPPPHNSHIIIICRYVGVRSERWFYCDTCCARVYTYFVTMIILDARTQTHSQKGTKKKGRRSREDCPRSNETNTIHYTSTSSYIKYIIQYANRKCQRRRRRRRKNLYTIIIIINI